MSQDAYYFEPLNTAFDVIIAHLKVNWLEARKSFSVIRTSVPQCEGFGCEVDALEIVKLCAHFLIVCQRKG